MKKYLFGFLMIIAIAIPLCTLAGILEGPLVPCGTSKTPPCTLCDIFKIVKNIIDFILAAIFILAPIYVLWGGFEILTSAGESGKVSNGKKKITAAVVGIIIALVAWTGLSMLFNALVSPGSEGFPWPWNEVKCEGGGIIPPQGNNVCCCDLPNGEYTCSTYKSETECLGDCEIHCKGFSGYIKSCCVDTQKSCGAVGPDRCDQMSEPGYCFNNNYSCQEGIIDQVSGVSSELSSLLACMANKLSSTDARLISSITDNSGERCFDGWNIQCSGSVDSCGGTCCGHSQNSLHYGGAKCRGTSYAVDFANEAYFNEIHSAAKTCASELNFGQVDVLHEGNHVHIELEGVAQKKGCL
jgi:hypothetical protein